MEGRAKYYEEAGVVRDMFQNHLLQLLTLAAMEPPSSFTGDAVRDEKVKVLRAVRGRSEPDRGTAVGGRAVRPGNERRKAVPGYRNEPDVAPRLDDTDLRGDAYLDRQLALDGSAVLSALG